MDTIAELQSMIAEQKTMITDSQATIQKLLDDKK